MKITPNQKFVHQGKVFEKGTEYDVPVEDYGYFKGVGWIEGVPPAETGKEQTLEIHDSELGHASEVN